MKGQYILLIFILLFSQSLATAGEKIEFWNTQRKGANFFNINPKEDRFKAAHTLGIEWVRLAYDKWKGKRRDFLLGNAGNYIGIVQEDLRKLIQVLDWAHKHQIKVVITPLGLPGNRWVQKNGGQQDLRLWRNKKFWQQSANFWQELASHLAQHPAVYAYNIINEPIPEMKTGISEHGDVSRYHSWYQKYKGTTHDLPAFYDIIIKSIRKIDSETPIMLDGGWYAQPNAFVYWPKINDNAVLYSFHMYEPYRFTSHFNFHKKLKITYPGNILFAGQKVYWDKQKINDYFEPFFNWAKSNNISENRIVNSEFGCYRRNKTCDQYLADVISILNAKNIHWAFYSFREDDWDGYDYEVGTGGLGLDYWKAKEAGENPERPRKDNKLFSIIKREF